MTSGWGYDLIRDFFATVDKAVYSWIGYIYQLILDLAGATVLAPQVIEDLYTRMYALLGLFMLFKVSFSFINYIINPDQFTDKTKGVQNIVKNIILVLIMIIMTPFAFNKLYDVQKAILKDNLIPNFIMGVETNSANFNTFKIVNACNEVTVASDGDYLALVSFRPFFQLEEGFGTEDFGSGVNFCGRGDVTIKTYLDSDIYNADKGKVYVVDYQILVSTAVGIVVLLILISFCFDIAVRTIKLAFLQIIAPIPIISYIDPAQAKNGMFSKWLKQIGATWGSLFIRLVALFFAILIISKIDGIKLDANATSSGWIITLFMTIGALMFAKQIPKILEELFPGLKLGGMQLNPFKKISNDALGGKALLGAGAATVGAGLGLASWAGSKLFGNPKDKEKDLEKQIDNELAKDNPNQKVLDSLFGRWDKMNDKTQRRDKFNKNFANVRGALHIDEIAAKPITNTMKGLLQGLVQAKDAAKEGFKQGYGGKFNPSDIANRSAKTRDYKEQYSTKDRIKDAATDFFGIKGESGTTSEVKNNIKKQEETLTRINRNIEMMNKSFSDLATKMGPAEFAKAVTQGADGKYVMNSSYNNPAFVNDLNAILNQMSSLESARLATTKEMKCNQGIQERNPRNKK